MESITSWTRLEPRCRTNNLAFTLQAKIHDPLWLLAQQWKLGELTGEDAGSPTSARVHVEVSPITKYRLGKDRAANSYENSIPLETLIEREPQPNLADNFALAADAGLHFLRLLADNHLREYRDRFIDNYPLIEAEERVNQLDPQSLATSNLLARRAPNGHKLFEAFHQAVESSTLPPKLRITEPEHISKILDIASYWLSWWNNLYSGSSTVENSWQAERMEYRFAVSTRNSNGEVILESPEYHGGRLDWYNFMVNSKDTLSATNKSYISVQTLLPTIATYPGMPVTRWWEFEDARINFARIEAEPGDLARQILVDYATVSSNDWFLIPIELPVGSFSQVRSLVVTDTFGERVLIKAAGIGERDRSWSLFQMNSIENEIQHVEGLFLAPTLPSSLESSAIEEVRFLRDEMANIVWAVEHSVESRIGQAINRQELYEKHQRTESEPTITEESNSKLMYRLSSEVPEYWFPLLPIEVLTGSMRLRRAIINTSPLGKILEPGKELQIFEEEIPREGIQVVRTWQLTRWIDGSTHVWRGKRKTTGKGEGSAGLRFDWIE